MSLHTEVGFSTGLYRVFRRSAGVHVAGYYQEAPLLELDVEAVVGNLLTVTAHGVETGVGPVWVTTDDTLPAPLLPDTEFWLIAVDENTLSLAESKVDALAEVPIALTDVGVGTMHINSFFLMDADIQEVAGRQMQDEPESQYSTRQKLCFTDTRLYTRDSSAFYDADVVEVDGEMYRVDKVEHFTVISNHFRATLEKVEP